MSLPAIPDDLNVGLEDYDPATDVVTPRLSINHEQSVFVNSLTGEWYPNLEVVILGVVKQRVMWPATLTEEKSDPLCKSYNFQEGYPGEKFPWRESGFNPADYPEGKALPCQSCPLREWGSHPTQNNPWCSETHTYMLELPLGNGNYAPALFSVQRTGIKPSRTYMSAFAQAKTPMFITTTKLSLQENKRGTNKYCVPVFQRGTPTDEANWRPWAQASRQIRLFVQTPRSMDDDGPVPVAAPAPTPAPAAAAAAPPPGDAGATRGVPADDDIPF
jgi:hypothetical protein